LCVLWSSRPLGKKVVLLRPVVKREYSSSKLATVLLMLCWQVCLSSSSALEKLSVSFALAQSTKLMVIPRARALSLSLSLSLSHTHTHTLARSFSPPLPPFLLSLLPSLLPSHPPLSLSIRARVTRHELWTSLSLSSRSSRTLDRTLASTLDRHELSIFCDALSCQLASLPLFYSCFIAALLMLH
jgi:hypothetical protein